MAADRVMPDLVELPPPLQAPGLVQPGQRSIHAASMPGIIVACASVLVAVLVPVLAMTAILQAHGHLDTSEPAVEPAQAALDRAVFIGGASVLLLVGLGLGAVDVPWRWRWVPLVSGIAVGTLLAPGYDTAFRAYGDDTNAVQGLWGFTGFTAFAGAGVALALAFRRLVGMAASYALAAGAAIGTGVAGGAMLLMADLEQEAARAAQDNAPDVVQAPGLELAAIVLLLALFVRVRRR